MTEPTTALPAFIARWQASGAAERANYQLFLAELCDALDLPRPEPTVDDDAANAYVFEKAVPLPHGTTGRIDLYRRGCFVLEAKQGSDRPDAAPGLSQQATKQRQTRRRGTAVRGTTAWDTAMERAREQAQGYARNLPAAEIRDGRPPFLIVVDVGRSLALYAEFSRSGGNYIPFPDPTHYRLNLADLADAEVRTQLRQVWLDPMGLDPTRRAAQVTRDIAGRLARLARSLEGEHHPEDVAHFLMRCLFTMFAEDVALLPNRAFTQLLADARHNVASFPPLVAELWQTMAHGGFSVALRLPVPHFDGGLFEEATALPLSADQLQLLIEAAQADWRDVEPAIFGTLLERALDPLERHKLGAHFTPRAYVERLVLPAIVEPLRVAWDVVKTEALLLAEAGSASEALAVVESFQRQLAGVQILDPACGSGNFLYVSLEHLKRLEGEVLEVRRQLGQGQMLLEMEGLMVRPEQFHGIEVNPRAAAIAELVLWIGFLQWHRRTHGNVQPPEPILRNLHNIECRDAVLAWDAVEPLLDAAGQPVTRWDGRTTRPHPATGLPVPDEAARVPAWRYVNPRPADWPAVDFVVGNPPFIGNKQMREALGDDYTSAVRTAHPDVPESADYVMLWWNRAAKIIRNGELQRFGFITTNSLRQTFNRRVLEHYLTSVPALSLSFAIPDHPWVDSIDGAAVRIAMTVATTGHQDGVLWNVKTEKTGEEGVAQIEFDQTTGRIQADLTVGTDVVSVAALKSNAGISRQGCKLVGEHFQISPDKYAEFVSANPSYQKRMPQYIAGRDITQNLTLRYVIDLYGLNEEEARSTYPELLQHLVDYVLPMRNQVKRNAMRERWWVFGEPRANLRAALQGLDRYIVTSEVSRHRFFTFVSWPEILPDGSIVAIALAEPYFLGVLSSRMHVTWSLAVGGRLGVGNDPRYNNTRCFEPFPFPDASDEQKARIRAIAEELDAHRKRRQALHPKLTLTDVYNVLAKLRAGEALSAKERTIHEQGLVSVLRQLHDALDVAVSAAYGWPVDLGDEEILARLVALNAARAAEEAEGLVRWLRPEFQVPAAGAPPSRLREAAAEADRYVTRPAVTPWPDRLAEQAQAVRTVLVAWGAPATAEQIAAAFEGAPAARVAELLETLVSLGQAERLGDGRFAAG